jgi:pimeloyl-ACP methyl ester carboxylesterase
LGGGPGLTAPLHVVARGEGGVPPAVVLVHGSMDRSAGFARVTAALPGRHVLRYDRRGYGRSRLAGPPVGVDGHADDLLALIHGRAGGRAVVVGHSYGGVVALAAADRDPGAVVAVGAFEAPLPWLPWWPSTTAAAAGVATASAGGDAGDAADAFLRRMLGDERWMALPPTTRRERRLEGPALLAELGSLHAGSPPFALDELPVPVLAGHGTRSAEHQRRAAEHLASCAGRAPFVIDGAQHGAHLTHPTAFADFAEATAALVPGVPTSVSGPEHVDGGGPEGGL